MRDLIHQLGKDVPVPAIDPLEALLSDTISTRRASLLLIGLFAGLAALLTAVGIYGIVAYSAARRTRELAIRAAIGAQRGQLLGLLVEKGLRPALAGVGVGLALSFALMPLLESLLFEVSTIDGPTFACVPLLMTALAAAASFFPARRASRMNPLEALRYE